MGALENDSIPRIQEDTTIEFKLRENIDFFLEAVDDYGVPRCNRFQVIDLFKNENMPKVTIFLLFLFLLHLIIFFAFNLKFIVFIV